MDTELISRHLGASEPLPQPKDDIGFAELIQSLAASQIFSTTQDALSYAEKRSQDRKEEERQESY